MRFMQRGDEVNLKVFYTPATAKSLWFFFAFLYE